MKWVELLKDFLGKKVGERICLGETEAKALVASGLAKEVGDDPVQAAIAKGLEGALGGFTKGLDAVIQKTLEQFAKAAQGSRKNGVPLIFGEGREGDPKRTFGAYLLAVATRNAKALEEMGAQYVDWGANRKAALNAQSGAQGGYTVPTEFHNRLMSLVSGMSIVRPRATIVPMTGQTIEVPALDVTTAPTSGETSYFGGLQANWEEEASSVGEEEPTFRQVKLQSRELKGYTLSSNSLLADDAIGLEALLMKLFAGATAWHEDRAFLRGTGSNQPLGVLTCNALISVTRSAASAVALSDLAGVMGRMLPGYDPASTAWVCHPTVLVKLLTLAATTVGGGNVFLAGGQVNDKPKMTILGLPIEVTDKVPALNTAGDFGLYDFSKYLIGDRQQIEIAFSEHVAFRTNQSAWRFISRVDGQPWLRSSVTLSDASSTLSPFVTLAAG